MLTDEERNHLLSIADTVASLHAVDVDHRRGHCLAAAERIRAIADAPPTVAELLAALPEPPNGRGPGAHRVEWSYDDMPIRASRYGHAGLVVERRLDGEWSRTNLNHADLAQPGRLVEVRQ